ncbi:MAG: hypothetical protein R3240_08900, partial [Gammaproteobacteria bacterium]|nr:hypothetical protein [Gammaproteobacteria bacterium]
MQIGFEVKSKQSNVTVVEIAMAIVVFAIVAVVALPALQVSEGTTSRTGSSIDTVQAIKKVEAAFERAKARENGFPKLSDLVEYLDADFASASDNHNGIVFWGYKKRVTVKTYNDDKCKIKTSGEQP